MAGEKGKPLKDFTEGVVRSFSPARQELEQYDPLPLLQALSRMIGGVGRQRAPGLTDPLPKYDPATGGIIEPPGGRRPAQK